MTSSQTTHVYVRLDFGCTVPLQYAERAVGRPLDEDDAEAWFEELAEAVKDAPTDYLEFSHREPDVEADW